MSGNSESEGQWRSVHKSATKRRPKSARKWLSSSDSESSDEKSKSTRVTRSAAKKHEPRSSGKSGPKLNLEYSISASFELGPKTPRSSSRLKEKANRTFSLPSRDSLLDDVSPSSENATPDSEKTIRQLKPRRLVNNFIRGRSSYVTERDTGMFASDSEMSDFIVDDDEEADKEDSSVSESVESDENLAPKTKKVCRNSKRNDSAKNGKLKKSNSKKRRRRSVSSSEDSESLDTSLSKPSRKLQSKQEFDASTEDEELPKPTKRLKKYIDESENDSISFSNTVKRSVKQDKLDSAKSSEDEELIPRTKLRKLLETKRKKVVVESSDSEPESTQKSLTENQLHLHKNETSESDSDGGKVLSTSIVRPRSRRLQKMTQKQEDKHNKLFGNLIQKRHGAKLVPEDKELSNTETSLIQDKTSTSGVQNETKTESESESGDEAGNVLWENSSEMDEDESDREFVVADDEGEDSDIGMNSDRESEFLQLLNLYARKHNPENEDDSAADTTFNSLGRKRSKKNRKRMHKWRRLMNRESEESEECGDQELNDVTLSLHAAVLKDDIDYVKECLKQDPDCVYDIGPKKKTALHLAAAHGNANIVKLLLKSGADRTACDSAHLTAVAYAADGHPECLAHLLDHTSIRHISKNLKRNEHQMSLLHFAVGCSRDGLECSARARCLKLMFSHDKKAALKLLDHRDYKGLTPLEAAVCAGQHECVDVLLKMGSNPSVYKTEVDGTLLHFAVECASQLKIYVVGESHWDTAVECASQLKTVGEAHRDTAVECASQVKTVGNAHRDTAVCLRQLLNVMKLDVEKADVNGFTPLMYACESGNTDCVEALLESGASVLAKDNHGTSSLHLAAMCGSTDCVQLLLDHGHQVDCLDKYGWPPLLYANFKAQESCVLALMKPNPQQIFVLGNLLERSRSEVEKKRTFKVVRSVLVSLANHDAYYTVFNDFIRAHPAMLDEYNVGLLQHTWRAILDFGNKSSWFRQKLQEIGVSSYMYSSINLYVDRKDILGSAMQQIGRRLGHSFRESSFNVTFKDEPGMCTGPRREFFTCLCKDVVSPERGLFIPTDDAQYSPVPISYFAPHAIRNRRHSPAINRQNDPLLKKEDDAEALEIQESCTDEQLQEAEMMISAQANSGAEINDFQHPVEDVAVPSPTDALLLEAAAQVEDDTPMEGSIVNPGTCSEAEQPADTIHGPSADPATVPESSEGNLSQQMDELPSSRNSPESATSGLGSSLEEAGACGDRSLTHVSPDLPSTSQSGEKWISCQSDTSSKTPNVTVSLRLKLKQLRFIGRLVGAAICQRMLLNLHLSKPFVKQILGLPLSHPEDLSSFDHELHKNAVTWVLENSVESLDLPFSIDVINPWNRDLVTIPLDCEDDDKLLDDSNKRDYVKLVSQFKLETSVKDEVAEFADGLHEVIPKEILSLFTADEFSLLLNGVTKIDVEDWKRNTVYGDGTLEKSQLISWFWNIIGQLKEEEKALLVKFTTGTPCIPIGGFAALQGLGGPTLFRIIKLDSHNKIPQASTCFNLLKLSNYDTEKQLREKLLIAIRHGAEGFSFG